MKNVLVVEDNKDFQEIYRESIEKLGAHVVVAESLIEAQRIIEMIKNGENGYLVKPRDVKVFAEKLIYLFDNPLYLKLMGDHGRKIVKDRYGIDKMVEKTYELYFRVFN